MTRLEPGQLWVMRIRAALFGAAILAAAALADQLLYDELGTPRGLVFVPAALLVAWSVLLAPARRWRAWGYAVAADELHVGHGVLTQVRTLVPFGRVQHIDVAQGPIERAFGVARLVLHTAGTANSVVVLPGVTRATAEALRDDIRAHLSAAAA